MLYVIKLIVLMLFISVSLIAATSLQQPPQVVSVAEIAEIKAKYGSIVANRFKAWQDLVDKAYKKPELEQLRLVNDFFNKVRFVSDEEAWGRKDYWATPRQLLINDAGDCEDYVIAKYLTLKALGVPDYKLFLTYVKAVRLRQAHMVLTYFKEPNTVPLVLDNINGRILKATKRRDLIPIYSFNGNGLWLARKRGKGQEIKGGAREIEEWQYLLEKLAKGR